MIYNPFDISFNVLSSLLGYIVCLLYFCFQILICIFTSASCLIEVCLQFLSYFVDKAPHISKLCVFILNFLCCVLWKIVTIVVVWVSMWWCQTLKLLYYLELLIYLSYLLLFRASKGKWKQGMDFGCSFGSSNESNNNKSMFFFHHLYNSKLWSILAHDVPLYNKNIKPLFDFYIHFHTT